MSYFQDGKVEFEGCVFHFSAEEAQAFENTVNYWHGPGDPSSWLAVTVFIETQERVQGAPGDVALDLAAQVLGVTAERLRSHTA